MITSALLGLATADALGVPVEFKSRSYLAEHPVTGMLAYGTHNQPAGTWSDDSSLTFCLAEMLCQGYDLNNLAARFVNWRDYGYWTPHGETFDIGIATNKAISNLRDGVAPALAGGSAKTDNGNGSLMRILPLAFYIKELPLAERYRITKDVSGLTHKHIRSVTACFLYLEMARYLLSGKDKYEAYEAMRCNTEFLHLSAAESEIFSRIISGKLPDLPYESIQGTGYVIHTLEAAIWCLLNTNNYEEAVLKAIHLGNDTDTTAAVTGGLAGIVYGKENIPAAWLNVLVQKEKIEDLARRLEEALKQQQAES
jgi:ADP-ribosyl-[dinitrogen reductase] hydrolase